MSSSSASCESWSCSSNKSLERKVRKPKIEKLRRARINTSLEKLKEILLRNTIWKHSQGTRPTKLEKADILEMSVRYIEMLHEKLSSEKSNAAAAAISQRPKLGDITNQISASERKTHQAQIINDNKLSPTPPSPSPSSSSLWLYNRFNLHQRNFNNVNGSDNLSDKENFLLNRMRQFNENLSSISLSTQQSIFSLSTDSTFERHWRPW